jgi:hypothetical protein
MKVLLLADEAEPSPERSDPKSCMRIVRASQYLFSLQQHQKYKSQKCLE